MNHAQKSKIAKAKNFIVCDWIITYDGSVCTKIETCFFSFLAPKILLNNYAY